MSSSKLPVEIKADVDGDFAHLYLVFSIDNGTHWYEVEMQHKPPRYSINLPHQPRGLNILYMFKAIGLNNEEFIENNQGQFFTYVVGSESLEIQNLEQTPYNQEESPIEDPSPELSQSPQSDVIEQSPSIPEEQTLSEPELEQQSEPEMESELSSNEKILPSEGKVEKIQIESQKIENQVTTGNLFYSPFNKPAKSNVNIEPIKVLDKQPIKDQDQTIITKSAEQVAQKKEDFVRPIIPYNPFTIEDGNIGQNSTAIQSFSKLIGARSVEQPNKQKSFVNRPQVVNTKNCMSCKAILNMNWKLCPICGNKY